MQLPTIHLNGTGREGLIDPICETIERLSAAYTKLKQAAPNGRDYYPQGPAAMEAARAEHLARLQKIDDLIKELSAYAEAIQDIP